jgi:hypothetical protein
VTTEQSRRAGWLKLLEDARRSPGQMPPDELERRRQQIHRLRRLRDSLPSIAPDTTGDYIRHIREADDSDR